MSLFCCKVVHNIKRDDLNAEKIFLLIELLMFIQNEKTSLSVIKSFLSFPKYYPIVLPERDEKHNRS